MPVSARPAAALYPRILLRTVIGLSFGLLASAAAEPAQVAAPPATPAPRLDPHPHPPSGLGIDLVIGWAGQKSGPRGQVYRLDYAALPVLAPSGVAGPLFGFHAGLEHWRSGDDNWGLAIPVAMALGVRVFPVRFEGGVGVDMFVVDQVADDTGFGFFCPLAMARAGLDLFGVQLGVDARYAYHWQIGAEDHARWQLGVFVGGTLESRRDGRAVY